MATCTGFMASCGTIVGSKAQVALVDAPRNLEVTANGQKVDIKMEETVSTMKISNSGDTRTSYSSPVIKVPKKNSQTLVLSAGSKSGTVETKPKANGAVIVSDIFLFGGVGLVIDLVTGNHKKQTPKFIDVPAVLAGKPMSEWRSQSKLKKAIKQRAK